MVPREAHGPDIVLAAPQEAPSGSRRRPTDSRRRTIRRRCRYRRHRQHSMRACRRRRPRSRGKHGSLRRRHPRAARRRDRWSWWRSPNRSSNEPARDQQGGGEAVPYASGLLKKSRAWSRKRRCRPVSGRHRNARTPPQLCADPRNVDAFTPIEHTSPLQGSGFQPSSPRRSTSTAPPACPMPPAFRPQHAVDTRATVVARTVPLVGIGAVLVARHRHAQTSLGTRRCPFRHSSPGAHAMLYPPGSSAGRPEDRSGAILEVLVATGKVYSVMVTLHHSSSIANAICQGGVARCAGGSLNSARARPARAAVPVGPW